jgi:hypothetical protein
MMNGPILKSIASKCIKKENNFLFHSLSLFMLFYQNCRLHAKSNGTT